MGVLDGKRILVTGASSGIGMAIARGAAERGARVACAARSRDALDSLATEIGGVAAAMDVSDPDSVTAGVDAAAESFGGLDAVVNCAGAMLHSRISEGRHDDWRIMVDVNLLGPLYVAAAVIPYLRKNGSGDIVNITSTSAYRVALPDYSLYSGTKAALAMVTRGLRAEMAEENIRVSMVAPGLVRNTGFGPGIRNDELREEIMAMKDDMGIAPSIIADQVCHLLSLPAEARIDELIVVPSWQAT